tara:strand:- start:1278 stop:1898 length:621 start_codon:yes stop_codon:yes gene_type:complete
MISNKEHIFNMSHEIICTYLNYSRTSGFKFKRNKSWDMIKWNAYENLYISQYALEKLKSNSEKLILTKSKMKFNGVLKRCFTLEHIFPTKCLINFFYEVFKKNNPTFEQTKLVLSKLNACCYVWQGENINISNSGLNSDIYADKREINYSNYFDYSLESDSNERLLEELRKIRYQNVNPPINALETCCHTKEELNSLIIKGEEFLK